MIEQIEAKIKLLQKKFDSLSRELVKQAKVPNIDSVRGTCDQIEIVDAQMVMLEWVLESAI